MANTLGNAILKTSVDGQQLTTGLDTANKEVKQWAKKTGDDASHAMKSAGGGKGLLGGLVSGGTLAIGAAVGVVVGMFDHILDKIGEKAKAGKQAAALGVDSSDWMGLNAQAKKFGIESGDLTKAMLKIQRSAYEASTGNKELAKTFEGLGLDANEIVNGDAFEGFTKVSTAIKEMGNVGQQADAATKLLSKQFQQLMPLLLKGGDAIKDQNKHLLAMGVTIRQGEMNRLLEQQKRLREANEKWKLSWEGLQTSFIIGVAPILADLAGIAANVMDKCKPAFELFGEIAKEVGFWLDGIFKEWSVGLTNVWNDIKDVSKGMFDFGQESITVAGTVAEAFKMMAEGVNSFMRNLRSARVSLYEFLISATPTMQHHGVNPFTGEKWKITNAEMHEGLREAIEDQKLLLNTDFINVQAWMEKMKRLHKDWKKEQKPKANKQLDLEHPEMNKYVPIAPLLENSQALHSFELKWRNEGTTNDIQKQQFDVIKAIKDLLENNMNALDKNKVLLMPA